MADGDGGGDYWAPGTTVAGRYEITCEIGRGGSAVVYGATDRRVGTEVALKVLAPPPALAHLVRQRTRREVLAARALAHPAVVPVFDLVEEGPYLVLVMEWVKGSDLEAVVAGKGPLSPGEIATIGQAIAGALAAAHKRGILHRDVKPRNVLVDEEGRARLTDFGSARMEGQETLTHTGGMVGTLDYAAPEVLAGRRGDARADLYALGMTLYFAAVGRLPPRPSAHLPPPPVEAGHRPREAQPRLPGWLDAVVARATAADPRRRFPTAAGLAEALAERALAPLPAPRPLPGRLDFCLSCGGPEPLGLMLCPRCGELTPGQGDTWLVIDPPEIARERLTLAARLGSLLALAPDHPDLPDAVAGLRVLARLTAPLAAKAIKQLAARGVPARAVSVRGDWRLVPASLFGVVAAMGVVGALAGMLAAPGLLMTTPPLAGVLLLLGRRGVCRPVMEPGRRAERLPAAVVSEVARTIAVLPEGEARTLLADVVRLGRGLFGAGGASHLEGEATALLASSCEAAKALGRVEESLARLEGERPRQGGRPPETQLAEMGRLEAARAALVQHLLDAVSSLGEALAHASEPDPEVLARLAQTSRDIREELRLREEARVEVEAALA